MFARRLILFLLTLSAILGCTREGRRTQTYTDEEGVVRLLPPAVPAGEQDSMAYLLAHYWDGMSFGDTLYSHDEEFVARALLGYRPYLSAGDSAHRAEAVRSLMSRAEVDTVAYVRLMDLSEELLYDRDYYDEYLPFAEAIIESDFPSEWDKVRPQEQVRSIRLNRPGTLANDFEYVTLQGDTARMSDLRGEPLVLFFYNAPCHSCGTKADEFGKSPLITSALAAGRLRILAVDKWGDEESWREKTRSMPKGWIHGRNYKDFDGMELYIIDHVPTIYLLDSQGRVFLRDTSLEEIEQQLTSVD